MNKTRRATANKLLSELETLIENVQILADEERSAFDNMSEGLQESERGQKISECADALESTVTDLETAKDNLSFVVEE